MKKTVKLDDILSIARGASPRPISNYITNESAGVNWIKIGDVDPNSFFITHTEEKITKEGAKKSRYVKEGDFILSNSMSFGRPYILKINGCVHDGWLILSDYENHVTSSYLYYLLRSPIVQNQFDGSANGATVRNLNSDIVRKVSVSIHTDKSEQQKIAALLDSIQSAIDNKKQQLAQLDELVKSKFVEMFGENPVESGKWKVEKIESVVDRKILTAKKKFQKTNKIKYVDISAIDNKTNLVTGFTEYVLEDAPSRAQQAINCDDILISTVRPNLRNIAINPFNDSSMVGSSGFCVLRVNETCNARYLFHCVLGDDFTNAMVDLTTGAAYPAIKDSDVLAYSIAVPPIELQNTFAEYVQKIDSAKSIIKTQLEDLQELLDSKMDEYFGE